MAPAGLVLVLCEEILGVVCAAGGTGVLAVVAFVVCDAGGTGVLAVVGFVVGVGEVVPGAGGGIPVPHVTLTDPEP